MVAIFPVSTKGGGNCFAMPDTCFTPAPPAPPVPVPYPNTAQVAAAVKTCTKIKVAMMPALHQMSEIPLSQGDEGGVNGGVMSGVNMNKVVYKLGSNTVTFEKKKVVFHTVMTGHNGMNSNMPCGLQAAPSQTQVTVGP